MVGRKHPDHDSQTTLRKRDTYLKAEFPHLWPHIEKFESGNTEYNCRTLMKVLGNEWEGVSTDLVSIGLLGKRGGDSDSTYWFPYVYRKGLNLTRGKAG